ncbi:MAG: sigma 54-interacting transcriptional regulator [bacterium]
MNYNITRKIGSGSFGTVYEALDDGGARCAAKTAALGDQVARDLLVDQFELLADVSHKRIVQARDFDLLSPGGPTLLMDLADGVDLKTFVEQEGPAHLVVIAMQVLDALRCLHGLGRLHGDLKPDTILVRLRAGSPEVTLVDAGFTYGKGTGLPTIGGTLPYLAPEIIRNAAGDARSDLYSLGVVLYEVLTGACPFCGPTQEAVLTKHLEYTPPAPSRARPGVAAAWDQFVARLTAKEPMLRYHSATHAALDLGRLFGSPAAFLEYVSLPRELPLGALEGLAARVTDELEQARSRREGAAVVVWGESGSGVSRLLRRVEVSAKARGRAVTSVGLGAGMPAFAQILEAVAGPPAAEGSPLDRPGREASGEASGGQDASHSLASIIDALKSAGAEGRVGVLVVDGAEAMDVEDLGGLARVAKGLAGQVGMVMGFRTSGPTPPAGLADCDWKMIEITHPTPSDLDALVRRHFGVGVLPDGLPEALHGATRGGREFLGMVLGRLWESGAISYRAGDTSLELAWDKTAPMPDSLKSVIRDQIGRLAGPAREALRVICLAGGSLPVRAIRELAPADHAAAVTGLVEAGLAEEADERARLRLRSEAVCEVVLEDLPDGWAGEVSRRLAPIVEKGPATAADLYSLGVIYLRSGMHQEAFQALLAAGNCFQRVSPGDAVLAYSTALACDVGPAHKAEANELAGDVRLARGNLGEALASFEAAAAVRPSAKRKAGWVEGLRGQSERAVAILTECMRQAEARGDPVERSRLLSDLGYIRTMQSRGAEALELLEEAKRFFDQAEMPFEAGIASNRIGIVEVRSGNLDPAVRAWTAAKLCFEKAGARRHSGLCLMALGACHWTRMAFDLAVDHVKRALDVFDQTRSLADKAGCMQNYAFMLVDAGDLAGARTLAREALELHGLLAQRRGIVSTRLLLALVELEAGNADEVFRALAELARDEPGLSAYENSLAKLYRASAEAIVGDKQAALALLDESYRLACEAADADGQRKVMLARAEVLLRFGEPQAALEPATGALAALNQAGSRLLAAVAERVVGEALCLGGRIDEGLARLERARDSLGGLGQSLHLARVLRAMAVALADRGEYGSAEPLFQASKETCRGRGARYDYARDMLAEGRVAGRRGSFIKCRRLLAEAGRVFKTLGIDDLHAQVMAEMERARPDETEIAAVTSLGRISQTLNSSHDLTTVLNLAMDLAMEYLGAERGVLMLEDEVSGRPTTVVERKMDSESVAEVIDISRSIVQSVRATGESVIASDATVDPRFMNSKSVRTQNVMSVMCVPLKRGDRLVGLIYLDNRAVPSDFSPTERAFVEAFANQVALAIENARSVGRLYEDVVDLKALAGRKYSYTSIVGPGKVMQEVFRQVEKAAPSSISVLVTGESGTGKELVAGLLHELSPRRGEPLVKVNCAAIHRDLLETELFGIEKHVATGIAPRSGFFERANHGTVLLDEIGDMPLTTQTRVLRVLAEKEFERVGGSKVLKVDVRVISATNQDLKDLIKRGLFRKDLYFRLNAMRIHLPPLRERMDDLQCLVDHFITKYAAENAKPRMQMCRPALEMLRRYLWPGNVRELEKCIEHALVVADGPEIRPEHLPKEILEGLAEGLGALGRLQAGDPLPDAVRRLERAQIVSALRMAGGVKTAAAKLLGIHESTLRKKIKAYGIDEPAQ